MLVKGLFDLVSLETQGTEINSVVKLNSSHVVFSGHFQGNPIVPGVLLIQLIEELYSMAIQQKMVVREVEQAKFLLPISGAADALLTISLVNLISSDENFVRLEAKISTPEGISNKSKLKLIKSKQHG